MKRVFILDENVYIQSHTCKNIENYQDNFNSLHLIIWMLEKCHKIGVNNELIVKYSETSKMFNNVAIYGNVPRIWKNFLNRPEKHLFTSNHLNDLPEHFEDDRHVIELAIFLRATLVTMDGRLKDELPEWTEERGFIIDIKTPAEILDEAGIL